MSVDREKEKLDQEERELMIRLSQVQKEKARLEQKAYAEGNEENGIHSTVAQAVMNLTAGEPGVVSRLLRRPPYMDDDEVDKNW